MKHLLGLIISLAVAGAVLTSVLALAQVQKAEVNKDPAKRPAIKFKVFEKKAEVKKEEAKEAVRKKAVRFEALQVIGRAGRVAVAPGEPNPQLLQQYRPMLWAEYHLARSVCDLSPEQRKAIARDAEHAFQEAIVGWGTNRMAARGIRIIAGNPVRAAGVANQRHEPDDTIREGLVKAVKDHLKPEQAAKYQEELDKRTMNRRRITIDNITARIDESLILTTDQRDKIRASLVANWQDSWCPSPEFLLTNSQMLPLIPDQFVVPLLNEPQKSIWRRLNKYAGGNFRAFGFMINNMMNGGDSPEDEILREAREAETKAREAARMKREAEAKKGEPAKKK